MHLAKYNNSLLVFAPRITARHKYEVQKINAQLRLGVLTLPGPWTMTLFVPRLASLWLTVRNW